MDKWNECQQCYQGWAREIEIHCLKIVPLNLKWYSAIWKWTENSSKLILESPEQSPHFFLCKCEANIEEKTESYDMLQWKPRRQKKGGRPKTEGKEKE